MRPTPFSDRILIIDHGTIVAEGTPAELKKRVSGDTITLTLRTEADAARSATIAARLAGADAPVTEANVVRFHVPDGATALPVLLGDLTKAGIDAIGVDVNRPTLDDVFLAVTGHRLDATGAAADPDTDPGAADLATNRKASR